jgi:hypothetical protein
MTVCDRLRTYVHIAKKNSKIKEVIYGIRNSSVDQRKPKVDEEEMQMEEREKMCIWHGD